ncbi:MAG: hypothetical protein AAGK78_09310, partial [Planctomycetota bacterium]
MDHPLVGTGCANFGPFYLEHRLPTAVEEVTDPHNLVMRFATELGIVGLGVLIVAGVAALWHVSRPVQLAETDRNMNLRNIAWLIVGAGVLHALAAIDFTADGAFVVLEFVRVALLLAGIAVTVIVVTATTREDLQAIASPASFVLLAALAGSAAMLLHAMVDFAIFEPAGMFTFALLFGVAAAGRVPVNENPRRVGPASAFVAGALL